MGQWLSRSCCAAWPDRRGGGVAGRAKWEGERKKGGRRTGEKGAGNVGGADSWHWWADGFLVMAVQHRLVGRGRSGVWHRCEGERKGIKSKREKKEKKNTVSRNLVSGGGENPG